ncbi:hypothetical protein ZWY2020_002505 [Hordeum vulgare]|nr:hypothetical protein ZWY2020_002505 [Hordeum vulgare]
MAPARAISAPARALRIRLHLRRAASAPGRQRRLHAGQHRGDRALQLHDLRPPRLPGPRLNLVVGPNGSGKSSHVCAIALASPPAPASLAGPPASGPSSSAARSDHVHLSSAPVTGQQHPHNQDRYQQ